MVLMFVTAEPNGLYMAKQMPDDDPTPVISGGSKARRVEVLPESPVAEVNVSPPCAEGARIQLVPANAGLGLYSSLEERGWVAGEIGHAGWVVGPMSESAQEDASRHRVGT